MSNLTLKSEEKEQLSRMLESASPTMLRRIQLIILYDQGLPTLRASTQAGFSSSQARFWKRQFLLRGLDIFTSKGKKTPITSTRINDDDDEFLLPASPDQPGVLPGDPMSEAGRKIIRFHFLEMVKHEAGTKQGEDTEELHDMRVATRRMRAAFEIFKTFYSRKAIDPHFEALKVTGRTLGKVRDLDVSLEKIKNFLKLLPDEKQSGLNPLLEHWKELLEQARQDLLMHLECQDYLDFKDGFTIFLETPGMGAIKSRKGTPIQNSVTFQAPPLIYSRFASLMAFDSILNTATYTQLHALRIEFKKFRYTLEFFREILGPESQSLIDEVKKLQDHLGELNDANVACRTITRFLKKWDKTQSTFPLIERLNPEPVVQYLTSIYAERHQLMVSFPVLWQQFTRPELRQSLAKAVSFL